MGPTIGLPDSGHEKTKVQLAYPIAELCESDSNRLAVFGSMVLR